MKKMVNSKRSYSGFTLIEVVISLAILGWVMGSSIYTVKLYADQRIMMRERFSAGQVAWNQLMEGYRVSKNMVSPTDRNRRDSEGEITNGKQLWSWSVETTPAFGEDLYQYKVQVGISDSEKNGATRTLYLVQDR